MNVKQRAFVEHYLTCWNATEAAKRAGYSVHSAYSQGCRLLKDADIQADINCRLEALKMGADEVLMRLAEHARSSIEDVLDDEDNLSVSAARERRRLHLVRKVKERTYTDSDGHVTRTLEVELYDAQAALVHLGRHHKLFVDRQEITGKDGEPFEIGVKFVDYRAGVAAPESRPVPDRDAPRPDEGPSDGAALG